MLASRNVEALNSLANELGQEQTLVVPDVTQRDQIKALVDRTVERFEGGCVGEQRGRRSL